MIPAKMARQRTIPPVNCCRALSQRHAAGGRGSGCTAIRSTRHSVTYSLSCRVRYQSPQPSLRGTGCPFERTGAAVKYIPPFDLIKGSLDISTVKGELRVSASYENFIKLVKRLLVAV